MNKRPEVKYVYLNDNLEIVDANREFYVYFDKVGHEVLTLADFVAPCHYKALAKFIKQKNKSGQDKIMKFQKHQDELRECVVTAYDSSFNGTNTTCLKILDVEESLSFFRGYRIDDYELLSALSITTDCIFSYWQSSNVIKITQFYNGTRQVLVDKDIDEWYRQSLKDGIVPENQKDVFTFFVEELKSCPKDFDTSLVCGFRTANANVLEQLSFTGMRFIVDEELLIVGRIMPEEDKNQADRAKKIIEEIQIDPLTKIFNKKTITARAEQTFNLNADENIALCIIDLDHFKPVNDSYGHLAGDRVLTETGKILTEIAGNHGTVGRCGGDEFLMILRGMDTELILRGYLHTVMLKIQNTFASWFPDVGITCSIGCAVSPRDGTTYEELFKKADFCLYRAKDKGRNRYVFFRDDLHGALYKKAIEAKAGIKYDDREIQELKYMSEFMQDVAVKKDEAINHILTHMLETYNLDNISVYSAPDFKRTLCVGKKARNCESAGYIIMPSFKALFAGQNHFRVDFMENMSSDYEDFQKVMNDRGIKSTVQCIVGTSENVKALVTFNRTRESSLWAEYEVNCAAMFASIMNIMLSQKN